MRVSSLDARREEGASQTYYWCIFCNIYHVTKHLVYLLVAQVQVEVCANRVCNPEGLLECDRLVASLRRRRVRIQRLWNMRLQRGSTSEPGISRTKSQRRTRTGQLGDRMRAGAGWARAVGGGGRAGVARGRRLQGGARSVVRLRPCD